jgi:flagellar basal body-associated protein FliL
MATLANDRKLEEAFKAAPFISQAIISFMMCSRKIIESQKEKSPEIRTDAMLTAVNYLQAAITMNFCDKLIGAADDEVPMDILVAALGLDAAEDLKKNKDRLKNMMELF